MKTKIKVISKRALTMVLAILMLFSTLMVGSVLPASASDIKGGTVYFVAPACWDVGTYSAVQMGLYQSSNNYLFLVNMTRVGSTHLYYCTAPDHSSWAAEQIMFMANSSAYGSGNFDGTNAARYTGKISYGTNSGTYYRFDCTEANTAGTLTGNYNSSASTLLKVKKNAYAYYSTNGSSYTNGNTGGTVKITADYLNDDNTSCGSSSAEGSSVEYETFYGANISYTKTEASSYQWVNFYNASSGGSVINITTTYVSAKNTTKYYGRFNKKHNVTCSVSGTGGTLSASPTSAVTGSTITFTATPTNSNYSIDKIEVHQTSNTGTILTTITSFTNNTATYTMPSQAVFAVATFKMNRQQYVTKVTANPTAAVNSVTITPSGGTAVSGTPPRQANAYNDTGATVTFSKKAAYKFTGWTTTSGAGTFSSTTATSTTFYPLVANATATANFAANDTGLTSVVLRVTGDSANQTYSSNNLAESATLYYGQPVKITVTGANTYQTLTVKLMDGSTQVASSTVTSGTQATLVSSITPTLSDITSTKTYSIVVTATNEPSGVTAATATTWTLTDVRVQYSPTQQAYLNLQEFVNLHQAEDSTSLSTYFQSGVTTSTTRVATYNTKYATADSLAGSSTSLPAYNNTSTSTYSTPLSEVTTAFNAMMQNHAKTSKIYVLLKSDYSSSTYASVHVIKPTAFDAKYAHFYSTATARGTTGFDYALTYEAKLTGSATYYLYSFSSYGYTNVRFYYGTSTIIAYDVTRLLGRTVNPNGFSNRYIDFKSNTISSYATYNSQTATNASAYSKISGTLPLEGVVEKGATKTIDYLLSSSCMNFTRTGSLYGSAPGDITYTYSIDGPYDNPSATASVSNYTSTSSSKTFSESGRYDVTVTAKVGKKSNGTTDYETYTVTGAVYVEFSDINVYIDMNGNPGTPTVNFDGTYNGKQMTVPYELTLVENSESIYHVQIKLNELVTNYSIARNDDDPDNPYYPLKSISVDGVPYEEDNDGEVYRIGTEALKRGQVWIKANSTNLSEFVSISYATLTNSYIPVDGNGTPINVSSFTNVVDTATGKAIMPIQSVTGTGVISEDDAGKFTNVYAAVDRSNYKFSYNVNAIANREFKAVTTSGGTTTETVYYFDGWELSDGTAITNNTNLNISTAPVYANGAKTYHAVYRVASSSSPVRLETTYIFNDYDTSDGNYVYSASKALDPQEYTKTIKLTQTSTSSVTDAIIASAVQSNMPLIKSNYFNYSYGSFTRGTVDSNKNKIKVTVNLTETARQYKIAVDGTVKATGYYMQTATLTGGSASSLWYTSNKARNSGTSAATRFLLGKGASIKVRFAQSGLSTATSPDGDDCLYITRSTTASVVNVSAVDKTSVILNSFNETYVDDSSGAERVSHNYQIIDFLQDNPDDNTTRKFVGGGVLYATAASASGSYRQTQAATNLASDTSRKNYIARVLGGDYTKDYEPQTIENTGFCYRSFENGWDIFRYSTVTNAYEYIEKLTNVNDRSSTDTRTLRVFSYYIYKENGTYYTVVSNTYAELSWYQTS